jgi:hypothetical protein
MLREGGYVCLTDPEHGVREASTFTCAHCNKVVVVPPRADPDKLGGFCRMCMKMICPTCVDTGTCDPFEKKLELAEASYHARRSYG